jgi:hypothetical protein
MHCAYIFCVLFVYLFLLFCSYFVVLCYFYCFVSTSAGLRPPSENPVAVRNNNNNNNNNFSHSSIPTVCPTQPSIKSGRGVALTTHSYLASRLKKKYSYISSPYCGLSCPVLGRALPFYLYRLHILEL